MVPGGERIATEMESKHLKKGQKISTIPDEESHGFWTETSSSTKDRSRAATCASCGKPAAKDVELKQCAGCHQVLWVFPSFDPLVIVLTERFFSSQRQILLPWSSKGKYSTLCTVQLMLMKSGLGTLESISQETMHSPICFLGRTLEGDNFFCAKGSENERVWRCFQLYHSHITYAVNSGLVWVCGYVEVVARSNLISLRRNDDGQKCLVTWPIPPLSSRPRQPFRYCPKLQCLKYPKQMFRGPLLFLQPISSSVTKGHSLSLIRTLQSIWTLLKRNGTRK